MEIKALKEMLAFYKQRFCRLVYGSVAHIFGTLRGNAITTFFGYKNFGDVITPVLLRKIGYTPVNSLNVSRGEFVFVGSVLDSIENDYKGVILGSGFLGERVQKRLNFATVLGVRGEFSKKLLGIKEEIQLGDGGLILPKFLKERPAKKYKIGIIPHFSDADDVRVCAWAKRFGDNARVIRVRQDPESVFYEICSCEYIISSSLHGLVLADSLGISNLWMVLSDLCSCGEFKFHDYYSAFGEKRIPFFPTGDEDMSELIEMMTKPSDSVPEIIEDIYKLFLSLTDYFPRG